MHRIPLTLLFLLAPPSTIARGADSHPPVSLTTLRCEYKVDPVGIDVPRPRLSWRLTSTGRGVVQAAYQVRVAERTDGFVSDPTWDTGRVDSDQSIHVVYDGPALVSGHHYYWQVRVWDGDGAVSAWSEPAFWEMGLLEPTDWQASWITPDWDDDTSAPGPSPMLRGEFVVEGAVVSARAYVTSLGLYEVELNGRRVGDQLFTPGWTSYDTRLQYQTYDVTALLQPGENALGATLGDGWYRGYMAGRNRRNVYGDRLALLAQIRITYADGRMQVVGTDSSWKATTGPIRMADNYLGETYDAPREAGLEPPRLRRRRLVRRAARRPDQGHPDGSAGAARAQDPGDPTRRHPAHAGRTDGLRHGAEHGGVGAPESARARRDRRHAAPRRGARPGRQRLHRQPPGSDAADRVHAPGRRRRDLRAALHLPGLPLRGRRRLPRRPDAGRSHRRRDPLGHDAHRPLRVVRAADQPAPAQHRLGPEGQLPRRAHRLPAARRAAGLDGRRPGLRPHGRLQHGRRGLLHEVARRSGRRPEGRRRHPVGDPGRPDPRAGDGRRRHRMGRRRRRHPVDDVPDLRRHPHP